MYERILKHLRKYGSITSYEAIEKYGCTRLSHYIYLLKRNGCIIKSETEKGVNRYGEKVNYSRYYLIDEIA